MPSGKSSSTTAAEKAVHVNKWNQCNQNHPTYGGHQTGYQGKGTKADLDHHSRQLNPNNSLYRAPKPK